MFFLRRCIIIIKEWGFINYSNLRLIRNWRGHIFISNLPNFEFIDFMHNKGQWGKLISDKWQISVFFSIFKSMLTMFLGLRGILHIMCSLLSTSWSVSLFWYCIAVCFCWFWIKISLKYLKKFRTCLFLFWISRFFIEKSGDFCTLWICCVQMWLGLLFNKAMHYENN